MGWLRDQAKEHGHNSLLAVAKAMSASSLWPADQGQKVATIANKLRDADKAKDLRWWTGTGRAFLPALGEVLGEDQDDLVERILRPAASSSDAGAVPWTFKVFPALRPIDLRHEPLFPGVPEEIVREGGPRTARTWWVAPPGAGKTVVGRWLEARFGWTVLAAARWSELEFPEQGRVFVELASDVDVTRELLEAVPKALKICVAAPRVPSIPSVPIVPSMQKAATLQERKGSSYVVPLPNWSGTSAWPSLGMSLVGFHVVNTPPAATWVSALIGWATARVKPGGGFDGERAQSLFRAEPFASLFETPGELLGFLGMMDDIGIDEIALNQHNPQRWIRAWMRGVMDRPDRRHAAGVAELLRRRGDELLVEVELERVRRGLEPALLEQEWAALIPRASAPPLDRERLLAVADSKEPDALEQIKRMLAPDPASIVQGLRTAGVLADAGSDRLSLRPAWVANTLGHVAIDKLYCSGPEGVGTLLLFPETSELALDRLITEVCAGKTARVEACAGITELRSPEQMAALNGAFRAAGLSLLDGTDVPRAVLVAIWEQQMSCVVQPVRSWPPQPMLSIASRDTWRGTASIGAWFLAAFAISLSASDSIPCSSLHPWLGLPQAPEDLACCMEALNQIGMVFGPVQGAPTRDPRALAVFRLGSELLDRYGVLRRNTTLLDLQAPDLLVELARGTTFEISDAERNELLQLRFGLQALEDACQRRDVPLDRALTWCWVQWGASHMTCPLLSWLSSPDHEASLTDAKRLWSSAPAVALTTELYIDIALAGRTDIWAWVSEAFWSRWLELWSADPMGWGTDEKLFQYLPEGLALEILRDGRIDARCKDPHSVRRVLWGRMPEALIALIDEVSTIAPSLPLLSGRGPLCELVVSAPEQHVPELIERARRWIASPASYPGTEAWVQQWLMHVIQQRSTGWRDAYDALIARPDERILDGTTARGSEPTQPAPEAATPPIHAAIEPPTRSPRTAAPRSRTPMPRARGARGLRNRRAG